MTSRLKLSAPLFALLLVVAPTSHGAAQSDGLSDAEVAAIAGDLLNLAAGSMQDAISDLVDGIDPSDPDGVIDPTEPVNPSDPGNPVDPEPADPGPSTQDDPDPNDDPGVPDGIDVPPSAPDEEGGFREIQLLPDPAPRAGTWRVTNHKGTVACRKAGVLSLKKTTESGRIRVRDDGRKLRGSGIGAGQGAPVGMTWDPDQQRYKGTVRASGNGGSTKLDFELRVISPTRMKGAMIARTKVSGDGISDTCVATRKLTLKRTGG